jgi:hypothetical protein
MYYERSFEKLSVPSVYPFTSFGSRRFRPRDRRLARTIRESLFSLSYDFSRRSGEKEPLGEGGSPFDSGEGRIGSTLTV